MRNKIDELFQKVGHCLKTRYSYEFEGSEGFTKMQVIAKQFQKGVKYFGGKKIHTVLDYSQGLDGLPKSDVLKYLMEGNCSVVVRPSGTEPKLKEFISVSAPTKANAELIEAQIAKELSTYFSV